MGIVNQIAWNLIVTGLEVRVESFRPVLNRWTSRRREATIHMSDYVGQDFRRSIVPAMRRDADEGLARCCSFQQHGTRNAVVDANNALSVKGPKDLTGIPLVALALYYLQDNWL